MYVTNETGHCEKKLFMFLGKYLYVHYSGRYLRTVKHLIITLIIRETIRIVIKYITDICLTRYKIQLKKNNKKKQANKENTDICLVYS
jgi:hypothetical protein